MSTPESGSEHSVDRPGGRARAGRRVSMPMVAVCVLGGVVMGVVGFVQEEYLAGAIAVLIMVGLAVVLVVGSRFSDTVALLGDDLHEERNVELHRRSALITLNLVAAVVVVAAIVDFARGGPGTPWVYIAGLIGVTYVGCLLVLNRRG
ncbi:hypothetical protein SAMN05421678_12213 [Actinopolymorpha cephalotaxi]|uniref:DUF2178 domain-containing protein n=1 Tax=Actinopolymorpha cephalotaxi TaxID=504797 RepID=A0A1I3B3N4_9ACTN|nr:hypothetical protein [Actinopolymorpha cephalotaxi]NYH81226.1 hypothetical protein [Actinopolymorpha cephalotaxi]SFH56907.1 hypothetical protein SAMN05421678_12213 [Actinopolymorpha cephalotaxi]